MKNRTFHFIYLALALLIINEKYYIMIIKKKKKLVYHLNKFNYKSIKNTYDISLLNFCRLLLLLLLL